MKKSNLRDLLNMFKWHPNYTLEDVSIIYVNRPKGLSILKGSEIERVGYKFIYLKSGAAIPFHRVVEVRYKNKTFWKKIYQDYKD